MYSNWQEWDGTDYPKEFDNSVVYYTYGEADLEDAYTLRNLARVLKTDGVSDSISDAIDILEDAYVTGGLLLEGDRFPAFIPDQDDDDESPVFVATWVEVQLDA